MTRRTTQENYEISSLGFTRRLSIQAGPETRISSKDNAQQKKTIKSAARAVVASHQQQAQESSPHSQSLFPTGSSVRSSTACTLQAFVRVPAARACLASFFCLTRLTQFGCDGLRRAVSVRAVSVATDSPGSSPSVLLPPWPTDSGGDR